MSPSALITDVCASGIKFSLPQFVLSSIDFFFIFRKDVRDFPNMAQNKCSTVKSTVTSGQLQFLVGSE